MIMYLSWLICDNDRMVIEFMVSVYAGPDVVCVRTEIGCQLS